MTNIVKSGEKDVRFLKGIYGTAIVLCILGAVLLGGCGDEGGEEQNAGGSPDQVVLELFDAARSGDRDAILACYTPEAGAAASSFLSILDDLESRENFLNRMKKIEKIEVESREVTGKTGVVRVAILIEGRIEWETFNVSLVEDSWKID